MTKIFKIPFATQGDRSVIPDAVQGDGSVSYTQGYSYDYERDQNSDPAAKDIEREKMNALFHDITEALGEGQVLGVAKWGEEGKPYPIRSLVYHNNKIWQSIIENNDIEPEVGSAWSELKADITANELDVYTKQETDTKVADAKKAGTDAQKLASTANTNATSANTNANGRVPNDRKVNNKALSTDITLTAGDVGSYSKDESDKNFQPKGNYATSEALKNGLEGKINNVRGESKETLKITSAGDYAGLILEKISGERVSLETLPDSMGSVAAIIYNRDKSSNVIAAINIPKKTGTVLLNTDMYSPKGWEAYGGLAYWGRVEARYGKGGANLNLASDFPVGVSAGITSMFDINGGAAGNYAAVLTCRGWGDPTGANAMGQLLITETTVMGRNAAGDGKVSKFRAPWTAHTNRNTKTDRNGNLKALNYPDELSDYPVGSPIPWPQSTAPTGYLICNGQSFNKTTYPLLALAYPSGVLPDLRGEFIRGLDAGRNVDSGRTALSVQSDENKEHTHSMVLKSGSGNGSSEQASIRTLAVSVNDATYITQKSGGKESRPRNIAFLYIVRAA